MKTSSNCIRKPLNRAEVSQSFSFDVTLKLAKLKALNNVTVWEVKMEETKYLILQAWCKYRIQRDLREKLSIEGYNWEEKTE